MKRERKSVEGALRKRQLVIINRPFVSPQQRCDRCTEPSGMITPDEAAAICRVSTRTVYRWLETGAIHFFRSGWGRTPHLPEFTGGDHKKRSLPIRLP